MQTGGVRTPDVFYARSGDVSIAYQVVGDGPADLVFVRGFAGDILSVWEQPLLVRFVEALAEFARVIMIDKRGTGLSDRVREVPTLETRMDDLRAVMDDAGSESAILWTAQEGARLATLVRGDASRTCRGPRPVRPDGEGAAKRRLPVGAERRASGARGCARSGTAGGAPSSSTPVLPSGRPSSETTRSSAPGFLRTCGAA